MTDRPRDPISEIVTLENCLVVDRVGGSGGRFCRDHYPCWLQKMNVEGTKGTLVLRFNIEHSFHHISEFSFDDYSNRSWCSIQFDKR